MAEENDPKKNEKKEDLMSDFDRLAGDSSPPKANIAKSKRTFPPEELTMEQVDQLLKAVAERQPAETQPKSKNNNPAHQDPKTLPQSEVDELLKPGSNKKTS